VPFSKCGIATPPSNDTQNIGTSQRANETAAPKTDERGHCRRSSRSASHAFKEGYRARIATALREKGIARNGR
ncbi:MAG TPA: hypothetical protein VL354_17140, partial [Spirochaetia bacterium]|nr:hypothetical protein [Spirochaetia bacterium]